MYDQEKTVKEAMQEQMSGRELDVRDRFDVTSSDQPAPPLAAALAGHEKAISELEMSLEKLRGKLQPVSSEASKSEVNDIAQPHAGSSSVVRAVDDQTLRIIRITQQVRQISQELEI